MGGSEDDRFCSVHELPRRRANVASFQLSVFPVHEPETKLPIVSISWHEAVAYCDELGSEYRLPTEAEWEYACRAGSDTIFPSGDMPDPREVNYLYDEEGNRVGRGELLPVGWGKANAFGLHDMLGNVCEWVSDDWSDTYAEEPGGNALKVIRGGGWDYLPRLVRPSGRDCAPPSLYRDNLGFRIARTIKVES